MADSSSATFWYLRGLRLHERAPDDVISSLRDAGKLERWGHRAEITRRDNGVLSVVLSGALDLQADSLGTVRLKAGDIFGETGVGADEATLRAYDDTVVCTVSRDDFDDAAQAHLGNFVARVGVRNRRVVEVPVGELLYLPERPRVAKVLVQLVGELGSANAVQGELPVALKPRHIADLAGLTGARSRAIMNELERSDLVKIGRNRLVLPNLSLIQKLVAEHEQET